MFFVLLWYFIHSSILPFFRPAILLSCHSSILPFFHPAILLSCHSSILLYFHPAVGEFILCSYNIDIHWWSHLHCDVYWRATYALSMYNIVQHVVHWKALHGKLYTYKALEYKTLETSEAFKMHSILCVTVSPLYRASIYWLSDSNSLFSWRSDI